MNQSRYLVCEAQCNHGIVQEFHAAVAAAYKLCDHLDVMEARFIAPKWLEKARLFVHTRHVLLRREPAPRVPTEVVRRVLPTAAVSFVRYRPITWEWIWECSVCGNERVYGRT